MKEILVNIYKSREIINTQNYTELKIQNNNIKFLRGVLLENCKFVIDSDKNWILKFFVGKSYEQNIMIKFNEGRTNYKGYEHLSSMCMTIDENGFSENIAENLSLSIRSSKAVKMNNFLEYPSHFEHIDGRGISFFSKIPEQEYNFHRQIILFSLAYAYLSAIEAISEKLSQMANCDDCNIDALNELYIEATKFNAIFFFHQPVLIKNSSLVETWKYIDRVFEVNNSSKELLEQLSNIHYILNLDAENKRNIQEKIKQNRQNRWNIFFAIIGILIAIVEILTSK